METYFPNVVLWDIATLRNVSKPLKGPLPLEYVKSISYLCKQLNGVYLSGIQVGDARRFAIPATDNELPVIYNPEIISVDKHVKSDEGCLSFPGIYLKGIPRYRYVHFKYRDQDWVEHTTMAGNDNFFVKDALLAVGIQHEVDHMDGKLFFDNLPSKLRIKTLAQVHSNYLKVPAGKRVKLQEGPIELELPSN